MDSPLLKTWQRLAPQQEEEVTNKADGLIYYPDSECETHDNVATTEPVCLPCMKEEIESLRSQLQQSEARVKDLEKEVEALKACIEGLEKSTFFTCGDCGNKVMHKYADEHFCDY